MGSSRVVLCRVGRFSRISRVGPGRPDTIRPARSDLSHVRVEPYYQRRYAAGNKGRIPLETQQKRQRKLFFPDFIHFQLGHGAAMKEARSWVANTELPEVDLNSANDAPKATRGNKTAQPPRNKHSGYLSFLLLLLLQEHLLYDLLLLDQESPHHPEDTADCDKNEGRGVRHRKATATLPANSLPGRNIKSSTYIRPIFCSSIKINPRIHSFRGRAFDKHENLRRTFSTNRPAVNGQGRLEK